MTHLWRVYSPVVIIKTMQQLWNLFLQLFQIIFSVVRINSKVSSQMESFNVNNLYLKMENWALTQLYRTFPQWSLLPWYLSQWWSWLWSVCSKNTFCFIREHLSRMLYMWTSVRNVLYVNICQECFIREHLSGMFYTWASVRNVLYVNICQECFICEHLSGMLYTWASVRNVLNVNICQECFIREHLSGMFYIRAFPFL